jgi:hypothetical protein
MYQAAPVTAEDILVQVSTASSFDIVEPKDTAETKKRIDDILEV